MLFVLEVGSFSLSLHHIRCVINSHLKFTMSATIPISVSFSRGGSSGSRNSPRYSRKRYGQPHRSVAECCHDAASHGPSRLRQEDWGCLLWHNQRQEGKQCHIIIVSFWLQIAIPRKKLIHHFSFQGFNKRPGRKFQVFRVHWSNMSKGERCKLKTSLARLWAEYQSVSCV